MGSCREVFHSNETVRTRKATIDSCVAGDKFGDGDWPVGQSIGVLLFEKASEAKRWTYSDPLFAIKTF